MSGHVLGPSLFALNTAPSRLGIWTPSNARFLRPTRHPSSQHSASPSVQLLLPSFILIRPTVWPQCTNVTDRTGQTDRQDRQQSDSIGRTVLQTVAQKPTASVLQCCCKVNNTTGAKYKYNTVLIRMKFSTIGIPPNAKKIQHLVD